MDYAREVKLGRRKKNWESEVKRIMKRYKINIHNNEIKEMKLNDWENKIEKQVYDMAIQDWERERATKKKLNTYNQIKQAHGFEDYLNGPLTKGKLLKFKLRSGTNALGEDLSRWMKDRKKNCQLCEQSVVESVAHFLHCSAYSDERSQAINILEQKLLGKDLIILKEQISDTKTFISLVLGQKIKQMTAEGISSAGKIFEEMIYKMWEKRKMYMFCEGQQTRQLNTLRGVNGHIDYDNG
jgi:hypothetical protein